MSAIIQFLLAVGSLAGADDFYEPDEFLIFNLVGSYTPPNSLTFNL